MSSSSDDDSYEVYTNIAKNMKDFKKTYMLEMKSQALISESNNELEVPSQPESSSSPPKIAKISQDLPVLSDNEAGEPNVALHPAQTSSRSPRSKSGIQDWGLPSVNVPTGRGRGGRLQRGRGRGRGGSASAASIKFLSGPSPEKYTPRIADKISLDDFLLEDSLVEEEDDNYEINVKVCWKSGKIFKFPIRKYQKLSSIFEHFSKLEGVPQGQILMTLRDNIISVDDTPDSLKLTIANIIEGGIISTDNSITTAIPVAAQTDKDSIELKIRTRDSKTSTMVALQKTQKMLVMMTKCAEIMEIPLEKLKFSFDGDALDPNDTPTDLDLEGGEMIDLVIAQ